MSTYEAARARAAEIGHEHGTAAITTWFDAVTCYKPALLLDQVNGSGSWEDGNGGPDTNPTLPRADLSGEWADGYTPQRLYVDCGGTMARAQDYSDDIGADLCDAYEEAFSEAVAEYVRAECGEVTQ